MKPLRGCVASQKRCDVLRLNLERHQHLGEEEKVELQRA